eukprot:CAMPEP_0175883532 /NCGR_PEP_ID=MMETSP0107_2-20121207/44026_1 /TAXON_ID=195067 ORGANISM="Goniomonas pacifica, Strain CCMP1869" /NCGR_SAMPLE_ID=MMETSP0107_2 /ASSEMBLY_ACC=CAM_ASM_000203 /LENGTH=31 /DNA_ID= /DNA_START= /DNA_END= /DNA_ORIENTATION=
MNIAWFHKGDTRANGRDASWVCARCVEEVGS